MHLHTQTPNASLAATPFNSLVTYLVLLFYNYPTCFNNRPSSQCFLYKHLIQQHFWWHLRCPLQVSLLRNVLSPPTVTWFCEASLIVVPWALCVELAEPADWTYSSFVLFSGSKPKGMHPKMSNNSFKTSATSQHSELCRTLCLVEFMVYLERWRFSGDGKGLRFM